MTLLPTCLQRHLCIQGVLARPVETPATTFLGSLWPELSAYSTPCTIATIVQRGKSAATSLSTTTPKLATRHMEDKGLRAAATVQTFEISILDYYATIEVEAVLLVNKNLM